MNRLRRLLCRLGLHSWEQDLFVSANKTSPYRICRRCHVFQWLEKKQ